MKFRKKPVVIEAEQYTGKHTSFNIAGLCVCTEEIGFHVHTAHDQTVRVAPGDWIVPEPNGKGYYPIKDDIFAATYEPADTEGAI